jgi:hypothetical protein
MCQSVLHSVERRKEEKKGSMRIKSFCLTDGETKVEEKAPFSWSPFE